MEKTYENLLHMLEKEVGNIEQSKTINKDALELLYYLTGTIENLKCLMNKPNDYGMGGMSGMSSMHMPMDYGYQSGARQRDSMGRYMDPAPNMYTRDNYTYGYNNSHNYDSFGYSRDESKKKMVKKLETLMDDTMSETERQAIQDCIGRIQVQ